MEDSRRFQRARLLRPLDARLDSVRVRLIDVSRVGLQVHHEDPIAGKDVACALRFQWNGSSITLKCVVVWTSIHRAARSASEKTIFSSGLRIESFGEGSAAALASMIDFFIVQRRQDQTTERQFDASSSSNTGSEFLFCELVRGQWNTRKSGTREQPEHGFTVSANEDPVQVQRLCAAYVSGDAETRNLIRTLSALSISRPDAAVKQ